MIVSPFGIIHYFIAYVDIRKVGYSVVIQNHEKLVVAARIDFWIVLDDVNVAICLRDLDLLCIVKLVLCQQSICTKSFTCF